MIGWLSAPEWFRVYDIPVRLHRSMWLFVPFLLIMAGGNLFGLLLAIIPICLISTLLHELGHVILARHHDCPVEDIIIVPPLGGVARLGRITAGSGPEIQIYLAGPLVSLILGLAGGVLFIAGQSLAIGVLATAGKLIGGINLAYFVFNLLPLYPMDGGRIFKVWLERKRHPVAAMDTLAAIGKYTGITLAFAGVIYSHLWLVLLAVFFWLSPLIDKKKVELIHPPGTDQPVDPNEFMVGPAPYESTSNDPLPPGFIRDTLQSFRILLNGFRHVTIRRS